MSMGIIGGADGPTAVFVTGPSIPWAGIAAAVLASVLILWLCKKRKNSRGQKPTKP